MARYVFIVKKHCSCILLNLGCILYQLYLLETLDGRFAVCQFFDLLWLVSDSGWFRLVWALMDRFVKSKWQSVNAVKFRHSYFRSEKLQFVEIVVFSNLIKAANSASLFLIELATTTPSSGPEQKVRHFRKRIGYSKQTLDKQQRTLLAQPRFCHKLPHFRYWKTLRQRSVAWSNVENNGETIGPLLINDWHRLNLICCKNELPPGLCMEKNFLFAKDLLKICNQIHPGQLGNFAQLGNISQ